VGSYKKNIDCGTIQQSNNNTINKTMDSSIQPFWQLKILFKNMIKHDINTIRYNYVRKVQFKYVQLLWLSMLLLLWFKYSSME